MVEMIVCFALLGIFMACAASLISSITTIYYQIKGEIYSREVSDIVLGKIVSEIDGAEYGKPVSVTEDHEVIDLYDKTGTRVALKLDDESDRGLVVYYYGIEHYKSGALDEEKSRNETDWCFDAAVYNGFNVTELLFYRGGESLKDNDSQTVEQYGLTGLDMSSYGTDVVLVLLKMRSEKYGEYRYYRFVHMYSVKDTSG